MLRFEICAFTWLDHQFVDIKLRLIYEMKNHYFWDTSKFGFQNRICGYEPLTTQHYLLRILTLVMSYSFFIFRIAFIFSPLSLYLPSNLCPIYEKKSTAPA